MVYNLGLNGVDSNIDRVTSQKDVPYSKYSDPYESLSFDFSSIREYSDTLWTAAGIEYDKNVMTELGRLERKKIFQLQSSEKFFIYTLDESMNTMPCFHLMKEDLYNKYDKNKIGRIRIDKLQRLFGIVEKNVFTILLWDKMHTVMPDGKAVNSLCKSQPRCGTCKYKYQ